MKIIEIELYLANIKLKEPFRIAIAEIKEARSLFVKIKTDEGLYGFGEANPVWRITGETQGTDLAAAQDLAKLLLGKNPISLEQRLKEMDAYLVHNSTIKSAFDMALYDIAAKAAGLPLYLFLGGSRREIETDMTVGLGDADYMAEKAGKFVEEGFRIIKIKLGTQAEEDIKRVEKIRSRVGEEVLLRVDANQGWDYREGLKALQGIHPYKIQFCEQPVPYWNLEDMKRLREASPVPITADESLFDHHDAFRLASLGCCDYFNIKLAKSGGINKALKIAAVAEAAGISCMVGCMSESRLGLTAAAHLAAARSCIKFADLDGALMLQEDPVAGGITYRGGIIELPEEPGLGAEIDPAFLDKCERLVVR